MNRRELKREPDATSYMYAKASREKIPLGGTFELSPICNFACRMCYVRKTKKEVAEAKRPMLTREQWLRLAKELKEEGMLYLLLTGGEPFLWPDFWKLYEELQKMGFLISINSNGSLIDEGVIERLKTMPPTRINITLYGASDETYEALCGAKGVFSNVDRAIADLQKAGIAVKLNCSLTPENAKDLEAMIRYADERNLILEIATYMFPPLRRDETMVGENERFTPREAAYYNLERLRLQYGEETYQQYMEQVLKHVVLPPGLRSDCIDPKNGKINCRAGKASFWITWDGWLTPCGMMNEPKVDVMKKTFHECWKQLVDKTEAVMLTGVCETCPNKQICHSCAAMALAETGSFLEVPRYLCEEVAAAGELARERLEFRNNEGGT